MKLHFQPAERSVLTKSLIRIGAVLLALLLSALFITTVGKDPMAVFGAMLDGSFGSIYSLSDTLVRMIPLLLCGLGVGLAARMQLWNIGAEGQFYMGAFASVGVALAYPNLSAWLLLPLMMLAGALAGGLWAFLPGLARAYFNTNETITTLLLNYVAINWVAYLVYGPWKDPKGHNFPLSPMLSDPARLPELWSGVHVGLLVALAMAVAIWVLLWKSRWGYEVRVIGESPAAARYAGISVVKNILLVLFASGALAGLAGMMEISGPIGRLQANISPGYGYSAIIIAYLAQLNPFAIVPIAFLFGGIQAGSYSVEHLGVPLATANMIQGIILFCVLGAEILTRYRLKRATSPRKEAQAA